jgi:hypothetical protein
MSPNLYEMTNAELKRYISEHRNDRDSFAAATEVVISRRNPANCHPYPLDIANAEAEVEAIIRDKIDRDRQSIDINAKY